MEDTTVRLGSGSDPLHPVAEEVAPSLPESSLRSASLPYRGWEGQPPPPPPGTIEVPKGSFYEPPSTDPELSGLSASILAPENALRPARGGRRPRKKSVIWEVIRSLTPEDITLLNTTLPAPRQTLSQIRHSHHQLAQLLAEGKPNSEAALLTGYSPTYISILKDDPTFQELCAYYSAQTELVFVDVLERMKALGLSTLDELQARLEADPSDFSNRELMEQVELMLVKPMVATRGGILPGNAAGSNVANSGVTLNVNFIGSTAPKPQPEDLQTNRPKAPTIEGEYASVPDDGQDGYKRRENGTFK